MGSSSSSSNQLQDNAGGKNVYTPMNFDPAMIKAFATTDAGKAYTAKQYQQLYTATDVSEGPNSLGAVSRADNRVIDPNFLQAFGKYQKDQSNADAAWQSYATLVGQQAGGEGQQTIIGSSSSPSAPTPIIGGAAGPTATKVSIR